jgi:hypothetical protein
VGGGHQNPGNSEKGQVWEDSMLWTDGNWVEREIGLQKKPCWGPVGRAFLKGRKSFRTSQIHTWCFPALGHEEHRLWSQVPGSDSDCPFLPVCPWPTYYHGAQFAHL